MSVNRPRVRPRPFALLALAVAVAVIGVALSGRGRGDDDRRGPQILAAASLAPAATRIVPTARVRSGGSDQLAFQIEQGIRADVFLSADPAIAARLHAEGLVGPLVTIAGNRLVVAVPAANPARIGAVGDLARPGVRLVVGTDAVPIGAYARRALAHLGLTGALDNVVSEEPDAGGIIAKVALGEADAAIVYATDAAAAGSRVRTLPVPTSAQPPIAYAAATLTASPSPTEARAVIGALRAPAGRRTLTALGFTVPER